MSHKPGIYPPTMSSTGAGLHIDHMAVLSEERLLPIQFYTPEVTSTPEKKLLLAALEDAFRDLRMATHGDGAKLWQREAREWFASDSATWPFSFVNVCLALGLEPGYIRRLLARTPIGAMGVHRRNGWDKRNGGMAA